MFVSLEGIDGSGKTTLAGEFTAACERAGQRVMLVQKSSPPRVRDSYADRRMRELAELLYVEWKEVPAFSSYGEVHCLLVNASYYAILDACVISPALRDGVMVVVDGWFYKLVARVQHNGNGSVRDASPYFSGIREPDRVIYLDVPPAVAANRVGRFSGGETGASNFGKPGSMGEFVAYQKMVSDSLRDLAMRRGWDLLDNQFPSITRTVETLQQLLARDLPSGPAWPSRANGTSVRPHAPL